MSVGLCKKCIFTAEIVDLFFISRAHKLYMGGNMIVGVVDLYFISRARVMCGREILLERLIYILYHEREIYMGGKYCWGVDLYFFYHARASHVWAGILLKRLKILKCIFTVLPYLYMGGEYFWGVDLYFISCAREL